MSRNHRMTRPFGGRRVGRVDESARRRAPAANARAAINDRPPEACERRRRDGRSQIIEAAIESIREVGFYRPALTRSPGGPKSAGERCDTTIESLVRGPAVSAAENVTLRSVAAVLSSANIGAALVRSDAGSIRMISERDIARALADDIDPDKAWSADVASAGLITADLRDRIIQVAFRMLDGNIRHIAIERDGEVIGVVSSRRFAVLAEHALEMF